MTFIFILPKLWHNLTECISSSIDDSKFIANQKHVNTKLISSTACLRRLILFLLHHHVDLVVHFLELCYWLIMWVSCFTSYLSDSSFSLWGISLGRPLRESCRRKTHKKKKKRSGHQHWPITSALFMNHVRGCKEALGTDVRGIKHFGYNINERSRIWKNMKTFFKSQASLQKKKRDFTDFR